MFGWRRRPAPVGAQARDVAATPRRRAGCGTYVKCGLRRGPRHRGGKIRTPVAVGRWLREPAPAHRRPARAKQTAPGAADVSRSVARRRPCGPGVGPLTGTRVDGVRGGDRRMVVNDPLTGRRSLLFEGAPRNMSRKDVAAGFGGGFRGSYTGPGLRGVRPRARRARLRRCAPAMASLVGSVRCHPSNSSGRRGSFVWC